MWPPENAPIGTTRGVQVDNGLELRHQGQRCLVVLGLARGVSEQLFSVEYGLREAEREKWWHVAQSMLCYAMMGAGGKEIISEGVVGKC